MVRVEFKKNEHVQSFDSDCEELGMINNGENWFITAEWASKFQEHLSRLLPLAEDGDVSSQYAVATIYICGYLHCSEEMAIKNHERDALEATKWLLLCSKSGHLNAIDNLLVVGVGKESDRVREIFKKHEQDFEKAPTPSEGWLRNLSKLHTLVWGRS